MYLGPEGEILCLLQDSRADVGAQRLTREELHGAPEDPLEELGQVEEVVVGLAARLEVY